MASPVVKLGQVVSLCIDVVDVDPASTYAMAGVFSFGRGLFTRGPLSGAETTYKKFHRLSKDMIVLSQLKAWEGAVALVSAEHDGLFLSTQFPTFACDASRAEVEYLGWYLRYEPVWQELKLLARGMGARRDTVSPDRFLRVKVPLPSLDEQRRIVARLDRVAALVEEARELKHEVDRDTAALTQSLHTHWSGRKARPFGSFIELWEDREPVQPEGSYPQVGIKGFAGGLFTKAAVKGTETSYRSFNRLHEDLLVVSQPKGWEGAVAICDKSVAGWFASPEYRTFKCREGELLPGYLDMLIRTPWFQAELSQLTRGQGARRERLRPEMLLALEVPMPDVRAQQAALEVIGHCRVIQDQHATTASNFDALLLAMLHEVFGGAFPKPEPQAAVVVEDAAAVRAVAG